MQKTIDNKLRLLELADELGVSQACKKTGYSRDSYYRIKKLFEIGGLLAIQNMNRNKPLLKNRSGDKIERAVVKIAFENPCWGQQRASDLLREKGILISASGVRNIWERYDMENLERRIRALETKIAQDKITPSKIQLIALSHKKKIDNSGLWTESMYPGDMGIQDIYYVGKSSEGGAKLYQQTFMDSYSNICFANLFIEKGKLEAINILRNKVLPFYRHHGITLNNIDATDDLEKHLSRDELYDYEDYLIDTGIGSIWADEYMAEYKKALEHFNNVIQNEFYSLAFRNKSYDSITNLQQDLDKWIFYYNNRRPYCGMHCYGKTPMQTFYDSLHLFEKY